MLLRRSVALLAWGGVVLLVTACGSEAAEDELPAEGTALPDEDMGLGELGAADLKADGNWGAATTCKDIPELPRLKSPHITISLHGLTLHLVDPETGYDQVFPIGAGSINLTEGEKTYQESRSMFPLLAYGRQDFEITPASSTACKIWWTDKATGETLPVFAGLPFLSWSGAYGIHGPIDNYRAVSGGNLRRGFVSHGCIRMQSEGILEVFGRIRGVAKVPVRVQREPERRADGSRVEVADPWFGAECGSDADCPYANAVCKTNPYSERGFCTRKCTSTCPDKPGYPVSFCVEDPDAPSTGMCVLKENATNYLCRPLDHFQPRTLQRLGSSLVSATVCVPGSPGWIGDQCLAVEDCASQNQCVGAASGSAGVCTQPCTGACPDQPGFPLTHCVSDPALGGSACVRKCTPESNGSECPEGSSCVPRTQVGTGKLRNVCIPS